jgi:hypothetical protein
VLTDAAYDRRRQSGQRLELKQLAVAAGLMDLTYTCPAELARLAGTFHWRTPGYASSRVLLDPTGEIGRLLAAIAAVPEEKAAAEVPFWFDSYLNACYRSLKAWRRGDELGARLQASDSMLQLARGLFMLERRWPPYPDRLAAALDGLAYPEWSPGRLHSRLMAIARTADPGEQRQLLVEVAALLRRRGLDAVFDAWGGDLARWKE